MTICNLDSHTKGQQAIIEFKRALVDRTGNLQSQPGIFPDHSAPIVRNTPACRELTMAVGHALIERGAPIPHE